MITNTTYIALGIGVLAAMTAYHFTSKILRSLAIGILVGVMTVFLINKLFIPYYANQSTQTQVQQNQQTDLLTFLAENSPAEYKIYKEKVDKNKAANGDPINDVYYTSELINAVLAKYGPVAKDDVLFNYLKINLELDKLLFKKNPILVLAMEFPEKMRGKFDPKDLETADNQKLLEAKINIITSAINAPQPVLSTEDKTKAIQLLTDVVNKLGKKYGAETVVSSLQQPENPKNNVKTSAEIIIGLYEGIIARGEKEAALIIKLMFLNNQASAQPST